MTELHPKGASIKELAPKHFRNLRLSIFSLTSSSIYQLLC
ncbi:protein of unknown function [Shewanella benthica]|uniref:Uncharacterized protein n=1 Tax=Shewanella benthica TaxID=43661 RepID=A0A330LVT2_9GAMM|nr:protein of unknown function [Shewanella benthica]